MSRSNSFGKNSNRSSKCSIDCRPGISVFTHLLLQRMRDKNTARETKGSYGDARHILSKPQAPERLYQLKQHQHQESCA
jgi:hypothetical protein